MAPRRHYAMWMFTAACPSRCTYCDLDSQKRLGHLDRADVVRVAKELLAQGFTEVMFAGGEPLLSPDLPAALEALRGRVRTTVFTGGLPGLAARSIEVLREGAVGRVVCSIDAGDAARNDRIRGRLGITTELEAFASLLHRQLPGIGRSINTVVSRFNADTLATVWDRMSPYGFTSWSLTLAGDFFEASPAHARLDREALQRFYLETVPALAERLARDRAELVVLPVPFPFLAAQTPPARWAEVAPSVRAELDLELDHYARGAFNHTFVERCGCPLVGIDIVVGVGGQIHPCSQAPIIHPDYVVGNVRDTPLAQILEGDAIRLFSKGIPHKPCTRCWAPSNVPRATLTQLTRAPLRPPSDTPR